VGEVECDAKCLEKSHIHIADIGLYTSREYALYCREITATTFAFNLPSCKA
jgi:hypothetical protein